MYGTDDTPRWYVGPNTGTQGANAFTGPLYTVTGSYFVVPWTGAFANQVGDISFSFSSATTGTLTYSVNSVTVTKNIVRQTWKNNVLTGNYVGGTTAFGSGCGGNGGVLISGFMTVSQSTPSITMVVNFSTATQQPGRCTYSGSYTQTGSLGNIDGGTFNCTIGGVGNALVGSFSIAEITNSRNGFNGRFTGQDQFCSYSGYFGGIKDVF